MPETIASLKDAFAGRVDWLLLRLYAHPGSQSDYGVVTPAYEQYVPEFSRELFLPLTRFSIISPCEKSSWWDDKCEIVTLENLNVSRRGFLTKSAKSAYRLTIRELGNDSVIIKKIADLMPLNDKGQNYALATKYEDTHLMMAACFMLMSIQRSLRSTWRVQFALPGSKGITFSTDATGCYELLSDRQKESEKLRRSPLIHWVQEHSRKDRKDPRIERLVREHVRGRDSGHWHDYEFKISMPTNAWSTPCAK